MRLHMAILAGFAALLTPISALGQASAPAPQAPEQIAGQEAHALADQFASDAAQHTRNLRDLYAMRGLRPPKMRNASLADVQGYLLNQRLDQSPGYPAGTAILFYAHVDGKLAIYLVNTDGIIAHERSTLSQTELDFATRQYRESLAVDGIDRSRAPIWRGGDTQDGQLPAVVPVDGGTFRPLDAILLPQTIRTGLSKVRHLIVISKGAIATNPFAAMPLDGDQLLVDRMSVTVSAGLFDVDQMIAPWNGPRAFANALVIGDPEVPVTAEWNVPRLPGAAQEAELIAERSGIAALTGAAATKLEVVKSLASADVLYFAAHGVSNPREPLTGGFLMLAGADPQNAFLTASEVHSRRLNAELAVLSACQSGLGLNHDGGVIGLARSFQKAGVPRVVMSLWSVSDEATLHLMDRFHLHVMEHVPAEALRLAMLDTRETFPDPALWAPFTLFGTPR